MLQIEKVCITGRMALRSNSVAGSTNVIGNKSSMDLPDIKGRAVWGVGNSITYVQTPFISDEVLIKKCSEIEQMFKDGRKKLFLSLLGEEEIEKTIKFEKKFDDNSIKISIKERANDKKC